MVCGGVGARKKKTEGKNKEKDLALGMRWKTNGVTQKVHYELGRAVEGEMDGKDEPLRGCE